MSKFQVGDVVELNSGGGLPMTVYRLEEKDGIETVTVVFVALRVSATAFSQGKDVEARTLDARMLRLVKAEEERRIATR